MSFVWNPENQKPENDEGERGHDPTWDKYFMGIALLCEKRSKDDNRQVGACVVNDEPRVIGTGYNGMPLGCRDRQMPWKEERKGAGGKKDKLKHYYVCHAELNAIVNKDPKSVRGCTVYVTLYPCNECAKVIVKSGIKRVVYLSNDKRAEDKFKASAQILKEKKITVTSFADVYKEEKNPKLSLNFQDGSNPRSATSSGRKPISWEQFFMGLAKISAEVRSSSKAKEGACVVNQEKRIVGLGYVDDSLFLALQKKPKKPNVDRKLFVSHAPANAIVNQSPNSLNGCTMYVTQFPCNECAKVIVQSGIKKIVYLKPENLEKLSKEREEKEEEEEKKKILNATKKILDLAHVEFERYEAEDKHRDIELNFTPRT